MEDCDLFMDSSSDDSGFRPFERPKINNENFTKKTVSKKKIEEIIPVSDSDSENFGGKSSLIDLTYEQFMAHKKQLTNTGKTNALKENEAWPLKGRDMNVTEKILELQKEFSFERASHKTEKEKNEGKRSSERKKHEKFREMVNESKTFQNSSEKQIQEKTSLSKNSKCHHAQKELEELKRTNHELRQKLTGFVNPKENTAKLREEVLIEKIEKMRSRLNTLITVKKASQEQEKEENRQQTKNSKKPINFMKDFHCSNCAKLLSKGIPTHFCSLHGKGSGEEPKKESKV